MDSPAIRPLRERLIIAAWVMWAGISGLALAAVAVALFNNTLSAGSLLDLIGVAAVACAGAACGCVVQYVVIGTWSPTALFRRR